jgi:glycerol-3-phosphate cytidylyltransferase
VDDLIVLTPAELPALGHSLRAAGKVVVWTNGCFDLFHAGHAHSLRAARALGDVLVVGVNADQSVRRLKGPSRPLTPAAERAAVVASLACVGHVVVFGEDTAEECVRLLRPAVFCKGADCDPSRGRTLPEEAAVRACGARVAYVPLLPGVSTTELIRRIRATPGGA